MLHRKIRLNNGVGVTEVVTSTQDKKEDRKHRKLSRKFEDVEALLDEDDSQTQKQLTEQLDVNQQSVSIGHER